MRSSTNTRGIGPRGVLARLMDERYPVYAKADITVTTRDERKDVIAAETVEALARHLGPAEAPVGEARS